MQQQQQQQQQQQNLPFWEHCKLLANYVDCYNKNNNKKRKCTVRYIKTV